MRAKELDVPSRVDRADRRRLLRCAFCRPNRGENAKRRPPNGVTKPKSKCHRRLP